jgi:hypothetical protein
LYDDPVGQLNCRDGSEILLANQFPDEGDVLWLASVVEKEKRDEMETVRVARRRGKELRYPDCRFFVDLKCKDDTDVPMTVRIDRFSYDKFGVAAINKLVPGQDVILVRGQRIRNFPMVRVKNIRCITNPEVFA